MTVLTIMAVNSSVALCIGAEFAMYAWMTRNPITRAEVAIPQQPELTRKD